jgi:long-chain acyl-CoA synthetase
MSSLMAKALPTLSQVDRVLTGPGAPFELQTQEIDGIPLRTYKKAPRHLGELLETSRNWGSREFIVYESERLTFEQHYQAVALLAHELVERYGVEKGDRVAIAMRNLPEWSISFWAGVAIGAIVVPLNAWWVGTELNYALADSGTKVILLDAERYSVLAPFLPDLPLRGAIVTRLTEQELPALACRLESIIGEHGSYRSNTSVAMPRRELRPDDRATLFYTSGTTGRPKGAVGSHRGACTSLMNSAVSLARAKLRAGGALSDLAKPMPPRALLAMGPLFHVIACFAQLLPAVAGGAKLVLMYKWNAARGFELIEQERITNFSGVPTAMLQAVEEAQNGKVATDSIQMISYGGSPSPPELAARLMKAFPTVVPATGYGLTETSGMIAMVVGPDCADHPASAGYPMPVVDIAVIAADGHEAQAGEIGEIRVRGPGVIKAYWNNPEATKATIVDGWLRTGDLGRLDEDGFVYLVDRAKDMIIRGGENVYCVEVENALLEHLAVKDAAVIGLPHPTLGEQVTAVVEIPQNDDVSEEELKRFLSTRLAAFKIPVMIELRRSPLPRNTTGKLLKPQIRSELTDTWGLRTVAPTPPCSRPI